jgi:hypothetical protein
MRLLFRRIKPSMKFRGCVQRLLRSVMTREMVVVEDIQPPTTVACTNRTYRTVSCGHFVSLCFSVVLTNVDSWTSERRKKVNQFLSVHSNLLSEILQHKLKFAVTIQHIADGYLCQGYQPTSTVMPTFTHSNTHNVPCHGSCDVNTRMGHLIS